MPRAKKSNLLKPERQRAKTASPRSRSAASARVSDKPATKGAGTADSMVKSSGSAMTRATLIKKRAQVSTLVLCSLEDQVQVVLKSLERLAEKRVLADMFDRYNIRPSKAFGVSMSNIQKVAKPLGKNHELALALWETGWYEARMATSFIDDPALVSAAQMDRWCRDFDNWGIVDTLCFNLFDRTPHAWSKVTEWSKQEAEFVKRAAFALLWSLTVHDKTAPDKQFLKGLVLIERASTDERHFLKKALNMALRAVGKRNSALNAAAVKVARRLGGSTNPAARWVGRDALRELTSPSVTRRLMLKSHS